VTLRLLVLVPHRDIRGTLRAWSASLFTRGLCGAWSFPRVMPLAELNRPLSDTELKNRAFMLRQTLNLSGGRFTTGPAAVAALSENVFVFGPTVNVALPDVFFEFEDNAVIRRVSPLVTGAALCDAALRGTVALPDVDCPAPRLSFRAAALANMTFRPMPSHRPLPSPNQDAFSFEWEIGKSYWLPRR